MAYTNIWVRLVWGTKRREPLLEKSARFEIFEHIRETARKKDIHVDFIKCEEFMRIYGFEHLLE